MIRKLQAIAVLVLMSCYAVASTVSIGTASGRGDIRIDSNAVNGNATLFNGSVIETGQGGADVRLPGTAITFSQNSRATLYRDRMVLEQGKTEFTSSSPFKIQADAVRVTPTTRDARWTVSVKSGNTVEVAALSGEVGVTNEQGVLLASILPGRALSFASQKDATSGQFTGTGDLSMCDGHLMLTIPSTGVKYEVEVTGAHHHKLGNNQTVTGTLDPNQVPACGAASVIVSSSWPVAAGLGGGAGGAVAAGGISHGALALIIGGIVVAGVGTFIGLTVGASTPSKISQ